MHLPFVNTGPPYSWLEITAVAYVFLVYLLIRVRR